eukprot:Blabericola_migrator_1__956@NODE_123_length_13376_cov_72_514539_g109_i0_p1_GENE_NODE_123_length_13376_cov_72_514539_g109_i0NODE_123_length_13376_cov_72_514539_g109_i0_p1_ORF_typecomplete_len1113_score199_19SMK1/PF04802_15/4_4e02SMK1/PF04802_15/5_8e09_NODE_123_length_13376_cov_72_514539_g109_i042597597
MEEGVCLEPCVKNKDHQVRGESEPGNEALGDAMVTGDSKLDPTKQGPESRPTDQSDGEGASGDDVNSGENIESSSLGTICQLDDRVRMLSYEVKLQRGYSQQQQPPEWVPLGTGSLAIVVSLESPDASRIVLTSPADPDELCSELPVLFSIFVGETQVNSASDGVVYLQLVYDSNEYLAFSFKETNEAKRFYEILGGKDSEDSDETEAGCKTNDEGLDFVAVFSPTKNNVVQFIEHLRKVEDSLYHYFQVGVMATKYDGSSESVNTNGRALINALLRSSWLNALWDVFDRAIAEEDDITLSHISELLVRLINVSCRVSASHNITVESVRLMLNLFYDLLTGDGREEETTSEAKWNDENAYPNGLGPPLSLRECLVTGDWAAFAEVSEKLMVPTHLSSFLDPFCILLSDQHFRKFLGAMERLPNLAHQQVVIPHVEFWKKQVCFRGKEILTTCVSNVEHQRIIAAVVSWVSRLTYARDVCLPRCMDDPAVNKSTVLINCGNILLIRLVTQDKDFFVQLQKALPHSVRVAFFLVQILRGVRSINTALSEKQAFFQAITQANVLGALEGYFTSDCPAVRDWEENRRRLVENRQRRSLSPKFNLFETSNHYEELPPLTLATEIMTICASFFPRHIQHAILQSSSQNHSHPQLWLSMTGVLRSCNDQAVLMQIAEIFKLVLHPNVFTNSMEKEDFLGLFFDKGVLSDLIAILIEKCDHRQDEVYLSARLFAKSQIVSIFCQCTHLHQSRIRYRFMQCNLPIKLVNLAVSLYKNATKYPLGHGVKSLLLQTIKFVKIFSVEQESGTGKDAVAALLPLLLPAEPQDLSQCGAASSDESGDEEGNSIRSNDSSHGNAWDSDDMSQENRSRRKSFNSIQIASPPLRLDQRHFQGTVIEAALLDLFTCMLKRAQEKKLTHHIRHMVEKNAAIFRTLSRFYQEQCSIPLFNDLLRVAMVTVAPLPSPILTAPLKHSTSQRFDSSQSGGKAVGVRGSLLKRGRVCRSASPVQSPAEAPSNNEESANKKSRVSSPSELSGELNKIQFNFASPQSTPTGEFRLPSVAKSNKDTEVEDALEALLRRGGSPSPDRPTASSPTLSSSSHSSGIQINFSRRHQDVDKVDS